MGAATSDHSRRDRPGPRVTGKAAVAPRRRHTATRPQKPTPLSSIARRALRRAAARHNARTHRRAHAAPGHPRVHRCVTRSHRGSARSQRRSRCLWPTRRARSDTTDLRAGEGRPHRKGRERLPSRSAALAARNGVPFESETADDGCQCTTSMLGPRSARSARRQQHRMQNPPISLQRARCRRSWQPPREPRRDNRACRALTGKLAVRNSTVRHVRLAAIIVVLLSLVRPHGACAHCVPASSSCHGASTASDHDQHRRVPIPMAPGSCPCVDDACVLTPPSDVLTRELRSTVAAPVDLLVVALTIVRSPEPAIGRTARRRAVRYAAGPPLYLAHLTLIV